MDLQIKISEAMSGRVIWNDLKRKYKVTESDVVVIVESTDKCLVSKSIELLREYTDRKNLDREIIICCSDTQLAPCDDRRIVVQKGKDELNALLRFYRMIQFTKNIVVISLSMPFGNKGIVGKVGITLEDYIRDAIYV